MKNLKDIITIRRHELIMEDVDVVKVIDVINKHHKFAPEMTVCNCGWSDINKYFIAFYTSDKKWRKITSELDVNRVWNSGDIPQNSNGKIYSTD